MTFAWYTHRYFPCVGGAENYGREMVSRFVKSGRRVDVLTSDAHDLWYFTRADRRRVDAPRESIVDGARVRRFPVRHLPLQRYFGRALSYVPHWPTRCRFESYMPLIPDIERLRERYDAVFAVGFPYTLFSYAALKRARASSAPLILTPFLHLATPGDPVHRHYTKPHQIRLLAEADAVAVQTNLEADAVAAWGIERSKILVLGMGVDHAKVTGGNGERFRRRHALPPGAKVVGHLATLDPNKGSTDLVLALELLNKARGDEPIYLVLAGPSSPEFERFAENLSEETRLWLRAIGPLAPEDRADFYAAIDLFSMPSRTDSYGIVFLEAWANAKPVVAARAGGVAEVIRHEIDGLLVPFGDLDRLSRALNRLIAEESFSARLGLAGFDRVSSGHSWDDRFRTLDDRVRSLIEAGRRAATA